jgi:hypothetical protein
MLTPPQWVREQASTGAKDAAPPPHVATAIDSLKEVYLGCDPKKDAIMRENLEILGKWDVRNARNGTVPDTIVNAVKRVRETFPFVIEKSRQKAFAKEIERLEAYIAKKLQR